MLSSIKSIGFYSTIGAGTGAAIGAGIGLVKASNIRDVLRVETRLLRDLWIFGYAAFYRTLKSYRVVQGEMVIGRLVVLGFAGGTIGLIYGISKEIFNF
jgi:sugar phosphate permease